jgi:putative glycosyltransferase (TIGR04348 family)
MRQARVVIVTPAAPGSRAGNRNTAVRWSRILRELGCRVRIATAWDGRHCDLLIALHARRSYASLRDFRAAYPHAPAILALTGTDLYRDIHISDEARHALDLADRYVVLQDEGPSELAGEQRERTRVIYQSETARAARQPPKRVFRVCVLGHLREEKDPFRLALALRHLAADLRLEAVQAGAALTPEFEARARALMLEDARYQWVGELAHWRALRLLARSHAMVLSSHMEGGAHVASEAIAHGVPVIASNIPGNRGMFGADYKGYYPVENKAALAFVLNRAMTDAAFLAELERQVIARRPLIAPARERECWRALLEEVGSFSEGSDYPASRPRS